LDRGVYVVAGFDGAGFDEGAGLLRGVYVVEGLAGLLAGGVAGRSLRAGGGLLGVERAGGV
jgi:hypothetical protein